MSEAVIVRVEQDGEVAVITANNPPVNTITAAVRAGLDQALKTLGALTGVRAVLLRCEGSTFFSGADIGEFNGPPKEAEYREIFARIEALAVPVVAAMHGTVLGGGLEVTLACHYRVAAPGTRFGLPEVTLGIIPGGGGTQRMPRLIGIEKSLELVLGARPVDTAQALSLGFLDEVIEGDLKSGALAYVRRLLASGAGPRRTSERSVAAASAEVLTRFKALAAKQYPNRIAPLTAIEAICASATLPFNEGLLLEDQLVNGAKLTPESRGSVHVFFAERETRKLVGLPESATLPIRSAGIIGAGTMGGGIAMCFANAGIPVTVVDTSAEALQRGVGVIEKNYQSMVTRGRLKPEDKERRMSLIATALDYAALAQADIVIEAVYENMDLKKKIFASLDKVAKAGAVLASNTSTLDVTEIARATSRPADVIGTHFFAPANVMPLLELIRTDLTGAAAVRTAMDLAKTIRKTPVLARVCYGFVGNRMMEGYAREAERIVLEGATPRQVDSALEQWGMAMGILAVFDMAGVDVGVNVHKANADRYPPDPSYYQADFALAEAGRLGQKNGKGYYRYVPGDRTRHDDPQAVALLRARATQLGVPQRTHSEQEILTRCLYPLLNEGFRILEERVVQRASDIDVVWTSGYGFPRYRGGPMFYAELIGLKTLLGGLRQYSQEFGPMHWEPAPLLEELVRRGISIADWEKSTGVRP
ncbi:MAG: 3-hydroxyacyl-CoA dehydrogenase NAD-binding domain-containing protein [Steroidobacteraceae bacterium]|jgi:3-hydroxyacyl-CoA dehydrogenase